MGYHHVAVATRDMSATDAFYTRAMGFTLVKVEVGATPAGGVAKHYFYDTGGGGMLAFWELFDDTIPDDFPTAISEGLGLPPWVNHIAFESADLDDLARRRRRLLDHGYDVVEIDHDWCQSVYATDPNGTLVEFCVTTGAFSAADRELARRVLEGAEVARTRGKRPAVHRASRPPVHLDRARRAGEDAAALRRPAP